jgi:V/A-type H+/Na+-transporting ATPase subunit A
MGRVTKVNGPVVQIEDLGDVSLFDLIDVGDLHLPGEVVSIKSGLVTAQVYEYTGGLRPGAPAQAWGRPLAAWLGPGLLGGVFDGTLRPLADAGAFLTPGGGMAAPNSRRWTFKPGLDVGGIISAGKVIGTVAETPRFEHRILVPPGSGEATVEWIAPPGEYSGEDVVARMSGGMEVRMISWWPVRRARPVRERLDAAAPLLTGQRVIDTFFPVAKGSTAGVPGGFGTGKTLLLQEISKWCDADVIVYVGCGERGNEMADVLEEFAELRDPRTDRPLMERTVIIANTSNMPVMAREASVYTGMTVAEYFRDMGYASVVIADSKSRWAEALREFASRTGQLPAEEGYPASLPSDLAAFYERSGNVLTLGGSESSVTVIASVSPPGADMTEPVTTHTRRFVRTLWSLDRDLAYSRHYPAVSWRDSFARDVDAIVSWYSENGDPEWAARRSRALAILAEADRLAPLVEMVGAGVLPDRQRVTLITARLLREAVLQQSGLSANDSYCSPAKQAALLDAVLAVHQKCLDRVEAGLPVARIEGMDFSELIQVRQTAPPGDTGEVMLVAARAAAGLEAL